MSPEFGDVSAVVDDELELVPMQLSEPLQFVDLLGVLDSIDEELLQAEVVLRKQLLLQQQLRVVQVEQHC
ncbi:MAG: hypothetical protein JST59_00270 [Actinobacteria bacterium]|nr:hypothetical protein [Actinomycetota bacterium]